MIAWALDLSITLAIVKVLPRACYPVSSMASPSRSHHQCLNGIAGRPRGKVGNDFKWLRLISLFGVLSRWAVPYTLCKLSATPLRTQPLIGDIVQNHSLDAIRDYRPAL